MKTLGLVSLLALMAGAAGAQDIHIGATAPLTGPQAVFGTTLFNGTELYFDEINAKGGINGKKLVLERQDDKADPKEGTLVAQKFCDDADIVGVIGHLNSGVQLAAGHIYDECGMPEAVLGSNPDITKQGFANFIRPTASDFAQGGLAAEYAHDKMGFKSAAIINDKQAFGQGVSEIFQKSFEKKGGKIVATATINPTDVDFSAVITQLKGSNPDVVYLGAVMPQLALFARQMQEQGLKAKLIAPDGAYTKEFIDQAGETAAENTLVTFPIPPKDATPELAAFSTAYKDKFKEEVGPYSVYGYISAQLMVAALEKAKAPTRDDLLPALKGIELHTVLGNISFDETGEMKTAPMYLYEIKNGDFHMLASAN